MSILFIQKGNKESKGNMSSFRSDSSHLSVTVSRILRTFLSKCVKSVKMPISYGITYNLIIANLKKNFLVTNLNDLVSFMKYSLNLKSFILLSKGLLPINLHFHVWT